MIPKEFIESLYEIRSNFNHDSHAKTITKLLDIVSADIYSESQRFFYELIQNADDSASLSENAVYIDFRDNALIVSHDGDAFSENDIDSVTDAGASTKTSKKATTGYKGIGFKSVFGKSRRVSIFSEGYQFRFDKAAIKEGYPWQTIPIWTELSDLPLNLQEVVSTLKHSVITIIEMDKAAELKASLLELLGDGRILLFLRRVNRIVISLNGEVVDVLTKSVVAQTQLSKKVILLKNTENLSTWLVRTFSDIPVPSSVSELLIKDEKVPEKLRSATHSEITFAAVLNDDQIDTPSKDQRLIYTFLPTKVKEYELPYLVNGNFLTNAPRESIHQDNPWNIWLFETIAHLNLLWLEELAKTSYKLQVLKLLPNKFSVGTNELKNAFNHGFNLSAKKRKILTAFNGDTLTADETLFDKTSLSEQTFIEKSVITRYLENEKKIIFKDNCFLHPQMEQRSKLSQLDVVEFSLDNITNFFESKDFVDSHKIHENFELIKFLKVKSDQDHTGVLLDELRGLSFIFDQDHILRNPKDGVCFPAGDGVHRFEMGDVPVIAPEIFQLIQQDTAIYDWFLHIGTQNPSESAYINNIILPQLNDDTFVTTENYLKITAYLVKMYKKGILNSDMLARLRVLKIKTKENEVLFEQAQKCYLSNAYSPAIDLESIIPLCFISEDYLEIGVSSSDMHTFFKALSVKDKIEIETITSNCSISSIEEITSVEWVAITRRSGEEAARRINGFGFERSNLIYGVKIPSFLHLTASNYEYSKIFWKHMLDDSNSARELVGNAVFYYGTGNGKNRYQEPVKNYFGYFVENNACLPTSLGTLEYSKDVYLCLKEIKDIAGEYFPVLEYDDNITGDWNVFFNFKNKLEIEDYLVILDKIAEKDDKPSKKDIKIIGKIYNKLVNLLPDLASDKKDIIRKWGKTAHLLATTEIHEPITELKRITKDGFSQVSGLKLIYIPVNCEKENLNELMDLFGVLTIREFIPEYDNLLNESTLKERFEVILPYLAAVAQKKSLEETNEFERLYGLLDHLSFGTADAIYLSFRDGEGIITGPMIKVFYEQDKISFQGKWKSERILLELIQELKMFLKFPGTNEEFRFLLLEPDFSEIEVWLKENDIDLAKLKSVQKFRKLEICAPLILDGQQGTGEIILATRTAVEAFDNVNEFVPTYNPGHFDFSKIFIENKEAYTEQIVDEVVYKEMSDESARKGHGKWAEEFVEGLLIQKYPTANITWMNKEIESYKPYDFVLEQDGVISFIDVKGTPSLTKDLVYLSSKEWEFMMSKGELYSLYRVYGTDSLQPTVKVVANPARAIKEGQLVPYKPCLEI
nr:DUF3883 domain-containing protein [uncultured Flavobacterium sp.]